MHYIRFRLGDEGREALSRGAEALLEVSHGEYRARQPLPKATVEELISDLEG